MITKERHVKFTPKVIGNKNEILFPIKFKDSPKFCPCGRHIDREDLYEFQESTSVLEG